MTEEVQFEIDPFFGSLTDIIAESDYARGPGANVLQSYLEEYGPQQLLEEEAEFTRLAAELDTLSSELSSEWEDFSWEQEILAVAGTGPADVRESDSAF